MKASETGYRIDRFRLGNVSRPTLCSHKIFVCQCADLVMLSLPLPRFPNDLWLSSVVSLKPWKRNLVIILSERFGSINRVNPQANYQFRMLTCSHYNYAMNCRVGWIFELNLGELYCRLSSYGERWLMVTFLDFYLWLCNALPMAVLSHEIISLPNYYYTMKVAALNKVTQAYCNV